MLTKNKLTAYSVPGGAEHFTCFISFNLHDSRFYYFIMGKLEFSKMKKIIQLYNHKIDGIVNLTPKTFPLNSIPQEEKLHAIISITSNEICFYFHLAIYHSCTC